MKRTAFQSARASGTPILCVETPDPAATMQRLANELNGKKDETPIMVHTLSGGLQAWIDPLTGKPNGPGEVYCQTISGDGLLKPDECLTEIRKNPVKRGIVFIPNAHRLLREGDPGTPFIVQSIWLCRDVFKSQGVGMTLVLLAPSLALPSDLARDVITIEEALPDETELAALVDSITGDAGVEKPKDEDRKRILDSLRGLARFEAEQILSMSLDPKAEAGSQIDLAGLWQKKVKAIEATGGLKVWKGNETVDDVAGNKNALDLLLNDIRGFQSTCLVFIDEADKAFQAAATDSSGVTGDQNKVLLSYIQDNDVIGATLLGPPGTGKTLAMKALAGTLKIPLIMMDLGEAKSRYVGDSEANIRAMVRIIQAISAGRAFFCIGMNRDVTLPPELRRRFSYELLYFDLPNKAERQAAWKIHTTRLSFRGQKCALAPELADYNAVEDAGWTGAEIKNACLKAYTKGIKLSEAAKSIVPVSRSASTEVEAARKAASGKYISASEPRIYTYTQTAQATGRSIGD